jgi:hypothetical protein
VIDGPDGSDATTCDPGGQSTLRRSNHPGIGSIGFDGAAFDTRSIMSRYFRSMTGQSY